MSLTIESDPIVSVIIPLKSLSNILIYKNLPALDKQTYKNFEVIVLPNEESSKDQELKDSYPWLRMIHTPGISKPARKRDIGVKHAKGEIIAFIDDDSYPAETWLEEAVKKFLEKKVAAVCGPGVLPSKTNNWEKIFDEILKTWLGSGGLSYRFVEKPPRYVDDYPSMNFLITKEAFLSVGGFNSEYWPGEDSKLCNDLIYKRDQKIYYHPEITVFHHRRNTLKGYLKQHSNYGLHRGAFFGHKDRNSTKVSYLVPTLFVLYLISLPVFSILSVIENFQKQWSYIIFLPLALYLIGLLYIFVKALINTKSFRISVATPLVVFLTHLVYGIFFVKGFLKRENVYE